MKLDKTQFFNFFIPMTPQPLQRSRSTASGRHYTPKESVDAKSRITAYCQEYLAERGITEPLEGEVYIDIAVFFEKPKCWWEGKRMLSGGDCDNHAKTVCDALQGVLFYNDKNVTSLHVTKSYADKIGYKITGYIYPVAEKPRKKSRVDLTRP